MDPYLNVTGVLIQILPSEEDRHKEARKGIPPGFRGSTVLPTLDSRLPEQGDNMLLLSSDTQFVGFGCGSHTKLTHWPWFSSPGVRSP